MVYRYQMRKFVNKFEYEIIFRLKAIAYCFIHIDNTSYNWIINQLMNIQYLLKFNEFMNIN